MAFKCVQAAELSLNETFSGIPLLSQIKVELLWLEGRGGRWWCWYEPRAHPSSSSPEVVVPAVFIEPQGGGLWSSERGTWKELEFTNTVREQQLSFRALKDHVANVSVYQRFHCFHLSSLSICILAWFSCICILSPYIFVMHLNSIFIEWVGVWMCTQSSRGERLVHFTVTRHSQGLAWLATGPTILKGAIVFYCALYMLAWCDPSES